MTVDLNNLHSAAHIQRPHVHPPSSVETTQTGSLNMQLTGYQAPYNPYTPHTAYIAGTNFPFTLTSTTANTNLVAPEPQHSRTADRSEESPMVGVCVQQSPVASH